MGCPARFSCMALLPPLMDMGSLSGSDTGVSDTVSIPQLPHLRVLSFSWLVSLLYNTTTFSAFLQPLPPNLIFPGRAFFIVGHQYRLDN